MNILLQLLAAVALIVLATIAMIVGQALRKKSITHCGCSSMTVDGEEIRCPGCKKLPAEDGEKLQTPKSDTTVASPK